MVNIDYFCIGALSPLLGGGITAILYSLILSNDLFVNIAPIYHFNVREALRWISNLAFVDLSYWLPIVCALLAGVFFLSSMLVRWAQVRSMKLKTSAMLLILCFIVAATDILNGSSFMKLPIHLSLFNFNVAYSGMRRSYQSVKSLEQAQTQFAAAPISDRESAFGQWLKGRDQSSTDTQLGIVHVESLGLFQDLDLQKLLFAPFLKSELGEKVKQHYEVEVGTIPFHGGTIDGEFRELCNVRLEVFGEQNLPKQCQPHIFRKKGYETTALHGFTSAFYNRYSWYSKLGFDRIYFAQDMIQIGVTQKCGSAFRGICDMAVGELFRKQLLGGREKKQQMVYWMTLNSHLPLDSTTALNSSFDCKANPITKSDVEICLHTRTVYQVLEKVADIANDPRLPRTDFVIVGDHAPPFVTQQRRSLYAEAEVPYIILRAKNQKLGFEDANQSHRRGMGNEREG